jgi:micrococcal nuclease
MKVAFFLFCALMTEALIAQRHFNGKVIEIIDGNLIQVTDSTQQSYKIWLYGIDCPEPGQEFADKAKKASEKILLNESVKVEIKGKDRWGNYLAIVVRGSTDPRVELLREGLAWTAEKNPIPELETIRIKAQEKGKGLWKHEQPTPPWIYRRQQSMMQAKTS